MSFAIRTRATSIVATLAICLGAGAMMASVARADEPDTSTPKKTAVVFGKAIIAGDMDTAHKVATGSDAEFALCKGLGEMVQAFNRLNEASTKKFGDEGKLPKEMSIDIVGDFEAADEKIDGDTATLIIKGKADDKFPPTFKKDGDNWKMDLSNMDKDPSSAGMATMLPAMTKALDAVTKNVNDGKYKTFPEALQDLGAQIGAASGAGAPPAAAADPSK
jgi:hypothetical protein